MTDVMTAALEYAAKGWHIFPVRGKRPAFDVGVRRWSEESSTDPAQIAAWYAGTSGLGVAVDLSKSKLAVIDGDHLDKMPDELRAILDTSGAWTHRGNPDRLSFVFSENGHHVPQAMHEWGEVKAAGGYIVLAPSPHDVGGQYVWLDQPGDAPAVMPDDVEQAVAPVRTANDEPIGTPWDGDPANEEQLVIASDKLAFLTRRLSKTTENRNIALNMTALILGHYVPQYLSEKAVIEALTYACDTNGLTQEDGAAACRATLLSGLRKGMSEPLTIEVVADPEPDLGDFGRTGLTEGALKSAALGRTMARDWSGRFIYVPGLGWHRWDGMRWKATTLDEMVAVAATWAEDFIIRLVREGAPRQVVDSALRYREHGNVISLVNGAKSAPALLITADRLDAHPDMLNCPNGVVNLRTGTLGPSDPALLFTKVAGCDYEPGATSDDWDKALDALEADDREHLRIRLGQAATGHPTPSDDVLIARGGGANGKTTLLGTVFRAIGEYAVLVSDKALMGNTRDHPTELMPFRGARLALLEETPEARRLEVARLKRLVGTETMTARLIAANPVSWEPTHTLIITTNYDPLVEETDHGTWRRLKMLRFSKTYTGANLDTNLRPRLRRRNSPGQKAALAWVIEGAVRYYAGDEEIPDPTPNMAAETARWRGVSDPVASFIAEQLIIDPDPASKHCVLSTDVVTQFNYWLEERGHRPWSETLLVQRLDGHEAFSMGGVERKRVRTSTHTVSRPRSASIGTVPAQAMVWFGLRWATPSDPLWGLE